MSGSARPVVMAKAAPDQKPSSAALVPLQMGSGRLPNGGQGANNNIKMNSIFQDASAQATAKLAGLGGGAPPEAPVAPPRHETGRPLVIAKLGQEKKEASPAPPAPPVQPPVNVQEVLIREGGPQGLTRTGASDINIILLASITSASLAIAAGETCVGVDSSTIDRAKEIQGGLARFASTANATERLDLDANEIDVMERVIACGDIYNKTQAASKGQTMAFVAGGLIIGTIVLVLLS